MASNVGKKKCNNNYYKFSLQDEKYIIQSYYNKMLILDSYLPLFHELCQEQIDTFIYVEEIRIAKKQRKIDTEVADLKRKLASTQGKNVVLSNREIRLLRYTELTDEERDKLEGSYKVSKKLERLQQTKGSSEAGSFNSADTSSSGEEDEEEYDDELRVEKNSYDSSGKTSPDSISYRSSSLTSPSSSLLLADDPLIGVTNGRSSSECTCSCITCKMNRLRPSSGGFERSTTPRQMVDSSSQTMSTGDIVITKVFFEDSNKMNNKQN